MPIGDAQRWNARYLSEARESSTQPRPFLVEHANLLPRRGLALDVAMGLGGNAGFLISHGLSVIGIDISSVAMRKTRSRLPALVPVVADMTNFYLPTSTFDVIVNFLYLQRDLWPVYAAALKPGGILIIETLTIVMQTIHPEIEAQYLLQPGELAIALPQLHTLVYREGWQARPGKRPLALASLIAQRPDEA